MNYPQERRISEPMANALIRCSMLAFMAGAVIGGAVMFCVLR